MDHWDEDTLKTDSSAITRKIQHNLIDVCRNSIELVCFVFVVVFFVAAFANCIVAVIVVVGVAIVDCIVAAIGNCISAVVVVVGVAIVNCIVAAIAVVVERSRRKQNSNVNIGRFGKHT